jgi:asparagine synthase (glutamine-hydrolysing)
MPGIHGLACNSPRSDLAELSAAMAGRLKHHAWYTDERHVEPDGGLALGRVSLGFVDAPSQPALNEDESLIAVMYGEVYGDREQRRALESAGHRFRGESHAEILIHGYEERGPSFFRDLHGCFSAAIWDRRRERLTLVNDRFGMRPLYYARPSGRLVFASEIKAILADRGVSREPNPSGIAQFFSFGQLLGEDTLLADVGLLPAAGWLVYDAPRGHLSVDRYWSPREAATERLGAGEYLDRLDEAFKKAVDRRTAGTRALGISLSGGLDSRTILAAVGHEDVPITSVSMGIAGSVDHRSAARMADLVGCKHHKYILDSGFLDRFEEHMTTVVNLTDGHYLTQCITPPTLRAYSDLGIEVLLRGHAGELMHMGKAYNFSLDRGALAIRDGEELESWLWNRLRPYMSPSAFRAAFGPKGGEMEGLARDSLRECLRESDGVGPPVDRISHLFLTQRLRRETAMSMVEFGSVVETRLPYLDNDLIDLLLASPTDLRMGDEIQTHILRNRMPAFLGVVNANTGVRVGAGAVPRFLGKARLKVLGKLGVPGYQHYEKLGLWLREDLRPLVERLLLDDRSLGRGIFDATAIRSVVREHMEGRNHTYLILGLMIFEKGQRLLADGDSN